MAIDFKQRNVFLMIHDSTISFGVIHFGLEVEEIAKCK